MPWFFFFYCCCPFLRKHVWLSALAGSTSLDLREKFSIQDQNQVKLVTTSERLTAGNWGKSPRTGTSVQPWSSQTSLFPVSYILQLTGTRDSSELKRLSWLPAPMGVFCLELTAEPQAHRFSCSELIPWTRCRRAAALHSAAWGSDAHHLLQDTSDSIRNSVRNMCLGGNCSMQPVPEVLGLKSGFFVSVPAQWQEAVPACFSFAAG